MDIQSAEAALLEAQVNGAPFGEQLRLKNELDELTREEEVKRQSVFFGISEEEARERIEQNANERASGLPRTIWPEPTNSDGGGV